MITTKKVGIVYGCATPQEIQNIAEARGYRIAQDGDGKAQGLFGPGFGGEAVVILKDGDNGQWVQEFHQQKYPDARVVFSHTELRVGAN